MNHASLFSGIGGPEIAAAMLGWDNVFHCEINDFGRAILEYWFPKSESYEDIKKTDFRKWRGKVDVLTGGFPCQPFSYAGQRRGADDDRYLWPEFKRVISEVQPAWVVGENVAGIVTMVEPGEVSPMESQATLFGEGDGVRRYRQEQPFTIERVCKDLEGLGYAVQPVLVPACAVGAPHRRDRVFIIANANECADGRVAREDEGKGREERIQERHEVREPYEPNQVRREGAGNADIADTIGEGLEGHDQSGRGEGGERVHLWGNTPGCCGQDMERHSSDTECSNIQECRRFGGNVGEEDSGRQTRRCANGCLQDDEGQSCGERWRDFPTVSPVHGRNDGLPFSLDDLAIPASKWRTESLKAYGNAIVPQVMYEIFRAIEIVEREKNQ